MESCKPGSIADLATLANLDGKVLLNELKVRYQENNIYVSKYIYQKPDSCIYWNPKAMTISVFSAIFSVESITELASSSQF